MSKYEAYKPSDVEWFGDIPFHWEQRKLKNVSYMKGRIGWQGLKNEEFTFNTNEPFLITGMNFKDGEIDWNDVYHIPFERYNEAPEIQLKEGDVLITKDGTIGKLLFVDNIPYPYMASLNSHLLVFRPFFREFYPKYLYYQLQSEPFYHHIELTKTGTTFFGITQEAVGTYKLILPPIIEQKIISKYLDNLIFKIDKLISNKKAQAEKLKELRQIEINNAVTKGLNPNVELKDSGIEWLGEIPKHWKVKHLKRVFNFYNNIRIPLSSEERADLENIYDYYGASGIIDKVDRFLFDGEYILVGEDGANLLDRSSPLAFKATGKFWVNNHAHIIKPVNGNIDFYTFLLESTDFTIYITGSAQPKLTIEQLSSVPILVLPLEEQTQIANYLQQRTASIDKLLKNTKAQIEKLQELRKIKIYEAVTGKIKVNAYEQGN